MSNRLLSLSKDILPIATLDKAELGYPYEIVNCTLPDTLKLRLSEMGLTPNTTVTVLKTAPLGDPLEIRVRGYSLCIRKDIAKNFYVHRM